MSVRADAEAVAAVMTAGRLWRKAATQPSHLHDGGTAMLYRQPVKEARALEAALIRLDAIRGAAADAAPEPYLGKRGPELGNDYSEGGA